MMEKIDWYQEVLDLEPSSKVFFPLAKLLVKSGNIERAVQTLQQGVDRHPEFIEARLYLIDLLYVNDMHAACEAQLNVLSPLFSRYAGFWQAWGSTMLAADHKDSTGLAVSLLAAFFKDTSLSMSDIFIKGLEGVLSKEKKEQTPDVLRHEEKPLVKAAETTHEQNLPQDTPAVPPPTHTAQSEPQNEPQYEPQMTMPQQEQVLVATETIQQIPAATQEIETEDDALSTDIAFHTADTIDTADSIMNSSAGDTVLTTEDKTLSLKTRSMAEVLTEQGDYAGALEIYEELMQTASSPEEAADFEQRITALQAQLSTAQEKTAMSENGQDASGKYRVLSVLEALAERLESRISG